MTICEEKIIRMGSHTLNFHEYSCAGSWCFNFASSLSSHFDIRLRWIFREKKFIGFIDVSMVGRLELYMKQNHENVERAESELNTLHEDMEQTLELQRRLAQR